MRRRMVEKGTSTRASSSRNSRVVNRPRGQVGQARPTATPSCSGNGRGEEGIGQVGRCTACGWAAFKRRRQRRRWGVPRSALLALRSSAARHYNAEISITCLATQEGCWLFPTH